MPRKVLVRRSAGLEGDAGDERVARKRADALVLCNPRFPQKLSDGALANCRGATPELVALELSLIFAIGR